MLKLIVRHIVGGREYVFYGTEAECVAHLRQEFPEARQYSNLREVIQAINDYGAAEVSDGPYQPSADSNLLPEDYLTHDEGEDPWTRES